ncbi:MAG: hypothetical protein IIT40_12190 [Prevotella sp.]|nr:hypothetical protein [Prevotella sp.]
MTKAIYFDMDGTIANLYGVEDWLPKLRAYDPSPYAEALPLVRLSVLARMLNRLQRNGYTLGIISWVSKDPDPTYGEAVTAAKLEWLAKHLPSVEWNEIHIVAYGTPKQTLADYPDGILFDDEERNREDWLGIAFDETDIIEILKGL